MDRKEPVTLRRLALAAGFVLLATAVAAAEPPPGTKNFTPPTYTPDYFSGEGGAFRGAAPRPAATAPAAAPSYSAPAYAAPARTYATPAPRRSVAEERTHSVRGRVVYTTARRGHSRVDRREVARSRRHEDRRGVRVAERRHAVTAHRTAAVHSRPAARRPVAHVHAAVAKGRRIARAGR